MISRRIRRGGARRAVCQARFSRTGRCRDRNLNQKSCQRSTAIRCQERNKVGRERKDGTHLFPAGPWRLRTRPTANTRTTITKKAMSTTLTAQLHRFAACSFFFRGMGGCPGAPSASGQPWRAIATCDTGSSGSVPCATPSAAQALGLRCCIISAAKDAQARATRRGCLA
jgi:hypothetical protein